MGNMSRRKLALVVSGAVICAYSLLFPSGSLWRTEPFSDGAGGASGISLGPTRAAAAEFILMNRGVALGDRARQLLAGAWLAVTSVSGPRLAAPPPNWMKPDFDDSGWTPMTVSPPPSSHPTPTPGTLWVTPSPGHSTPPAASPTGAQALSPTAVPVPATTMPGAVPRSAAHTTDGGLIFSDDGTVDGGTARDAGVPHDGSVATDGGVRDAGAVPMPPPCAGTLYVRRFFSVGAAALGRLSSSPSMLDLRIRYSDGFVAYLNGVELLRRRLPEAVPVEPNTLAVDRGTVEPETHHLQIPPGLLLPEGNLLAIEIHPRAAERCPRAEFELIGADGPRIVRGPFIERLLDGALDLTVETDTPTHIEVVYGKGEERRGRDKRMASATDAAGQTQPPQTVHRVHITGLRPGNTYHYQVSIVPTTAGATRLELPVIPIHTPPTAVRPLRFVVYGDSRSGHAIHAQVVQAILDEDPDLVLSIGDLVERGTEDSDWDRFFAVATPLLQRVPFFMAPGNHEYARRGQGAVNLFKIWNRHFPPQTVPGGSNTPPSHVMATPRPPVAGEPEAGPRGFYSFDIAGVHFVALDSNQLRNGEQLRWLEADLERIRPKRPRALIVFMHDGPYSTGWHGDNSTLIRDYVPVLERNRVNMVFSGHDHDYERGHRGRLDYIVTGGGGAELRPLKCGVPGKKRCKHPPLAFYNEHNYVSVEVLPGALRICPKRPDASELEPCQLIKK